GNITDEFNLPSWFVSNYVVVATGSVSGTALTSFTDGAVRIRAIFAGGTPPASAPISWVRYSNTTCNPGAGNVFVIDQSASLVAAATPGNGANLPVGVSATQSVRLTPGAVTGYAFSTWGNGNFTTG